MTQILKANMLNMLICQIYTQESHSNIAQVQYGLQKLFFSLKKKQIQTPDQKSIVERHEGIKTTWLSSGFPCYNSNCFQYLALAVTYIHTLSSLQ